LSSRIGFALAVLILIMAAALRLWNLSLLPPGLNDEEIRDIRITESIRAGRIEAFYNLSSLGSEGGREGLYHIILASVSTISGSGLIGYRILSVLVNLLALALVYAVGMRLYGPLAGVAAMALLAVGFWPILVSREIGRETFLPLLVAAVLLALAKALPVYQQHRESGTMPYAALALLLGLGFYIHPTNFLLTLASMLFIVYMVFSPRQLSRRVLSYTSFALLMLIIIVTPYVISSIRLPALDGAGRVFGGYTIAQRAPLDAILSGINGLLFAGDTNPARNLPGRPLVDLVSGLLILIGMITAVRHWRRPRYMLLLIMTLILLPVAFLTIDSPNFAAFTPVLPLLALFFGLGVATLYGSLTANARRIMSLGLVALFVFNVVWTVRDLFDVWPHLPETRSVYNDRAGELAHYLDLTAEAIPTVVCVPTRLQTDLTNTQLISLMMNRKEHPVRYVDCGTGMVFARGGERQQVILPDEGMFNQIHPYIRDWLSYGTPQTDNDLPPDAVIVMDVVQELSESKIGGFTTTTPVSFAPESPGGAQVVYPPVRFGGNITFLGYEPETGGAYQPGGIVTAITYWRVDGPLPPDLSLFTHILSDPAAIISQQDTISVVPAQLEPRDIFIQISFVSLPPSTPDGQYEISIGAYQRSDNMRLGVFDGDQPRGSRLFLVGKTITVAGKQGG
jgi:hypothetical protein